VKRVIRKQIHTQWTNSPQIHPIDTAEEMPESKFKKRTQGVLGR